MPSDVILDLFGSAGTLVSAWLLREMVLVGTVFAILSVTSTALRSVALGEHVSIFVVARLLPMLLLYSFLVFYPVTVADLGKDLGQIRASFAGFATLDPGRVLGQGLSLAIKLWEETAFLPPVPPFVIFKTAPVTIVLLVYGWLALEVLVVLVEAEIAKGVGPFFLGMGQSKYTWPFVAHFFAFQANVGVRLFLLYVVFFFGNVLAVLYWDLLDDAGFLDLGTLFEATVGTVAFAWVGIRLPRRWADSLSSAIANHLPNPYHA